MNKKLHDAFTDALHRIEGFQVRGPDRRGRNPSGQVYTGPERRGQIAFRRRRSDQIATANNVPIGDTDPISILASA